MVEGKKAGGTTLEKQKECICYLLLNSITPSKRMNPMGRSVSRETSLPMQFLTTWEHAENILGANTILNYFIGIMVLKFLIND